MRRVIFSLLVFVGTANSPRAEERVSLKAVQSSQINGVQIAIAGDGLSDRTNTIPKRYLGCMKEQVEILKRYLNANQSKFDSTFNDVYIHFDPNNFPEASAIPSYLSRAKNTLKLGIRPHILGIRPVDLRPLLSGKAPTVSPSLCDLAEESEIERAVQREQDRINENRRQTQKILNTDEVSGEEIDLDSH